MWFKYYNNCLPHYLYKIVLIFVHVHTLYCIIKNFLLAHKIPKFLWKLVIEPLVRSLRFFSDLQPRLMSIDVCKDTCLPIYTIYGETLIKNLLLLHKNAKAIINIHQELN